jgi:hypothetical protein
MEAVQQISKSTVLYDILRVHLIEFSKLLNAARKKYHVLIVSSPEQNSISPIQT